MFVLASPIVDWNAMWKIFLVALAAGAGVVVAFGLLLLGLKFSQGPATHGIPDAGANGTSRAGADGTHRAGADGTHRAGADGTDRAGADGTPRAGADRTPSAGARLGGFTLALVCGLICVGIVAIGVYAMTQKPSSKPAKPKSALVIPAGSRVTVIASSR